MGDQDIRTDRCPECGSLLSDPRHGRFHLAEMEGFPLPARLPSTRLGEWTAAPVTYQIDWAPGGGVAGQPGLGEFLEWITPEPPLPHYTSLLGAYAGERLAVIILMDKAIPQAFFDPQDPAYPEIGAARPIDPQAFLAGLVPNPALGLQTDETMGLVLIWVAVAHQNKGLATQMVRMFSDWAGIPINKLYVDRPLGAGGITFVKRAFPDGYSSHWKKG
jgi:hypothetical protein